MNDITTTKIRVQLTETGSAMWKDRSVNMGCSHRCAPESIASVMAARAGEPAPSEIELEIEGEALPHNIAAAMKIKPEKFDTHVGSWEEDTDDPEWEALEARVRALDARYHRAMAHPASQLAVSLGDASQAITSPPSPEDELEDRWEALPIPQAPYSHSKAFAALLAALALGIVLGWLLGR